jgi:sugar/nucleoside kinase (ribokinase family)
VVRHRHEATLTTTLDLATLADQLGYLFGEVPIVTPVDVSGAGDNAHGYLLQLGLENDIAEAPRRCRRPTCRASLRRWRRVSMPAYRPAVSGL